MYGIKTKDITICATDMPNRKKKCLCVERGNTLTKYATFNNDKSADEFLRILAEFVGMERTENEFT